jgi:hypothetical protein
MYYTYSGKLTHHAAPTVENVAISLMRESRYCGNGKHWWPVGLHCFVVADLLPNHLKLHGLVHDQPECITGDTPYHMKTEVQSALEDVLLARFYNALGIKLPTPEEHKQVKRIDRLVVRGEVHAGAGTLSLRPNYKPESKSFKLVKHYMEHYSYADCLDYDGRAVKEFIRRFEAYKALFHTNYICSGPAYKL